MKNKHKETLWGVINTIAMALVIVLSFYFSLPGEV